MLNRHFCELYKPKIEIRYMLLDHVVIPQRMCLHLFKCLIAHDLRSGDIQLRQLAVA